jgi:hypothetical protein
LKGFCGNNVCDEGENTGNCFVDCFNTTKPQDLTLAVAVVLVFIGFAVALITVK